MTKIVHENYVDAIGKCCELLLSVQRADADHVYSGGTIEEEGYGQLLCMNGDHVEHHTMLGRRRSSFSMPTSPMLPFTTGGIFLYVYCIARYILRFAGGLQLQLQLMGNISNRDCDA